MTMLPWLLAWVLLVLLILTLYTTATRWRRVDKRPPDPFRTPPGPTGEEYPPGARPAGPGAEGMAVSRPGDIIPGRPDDRSRDSETDEDESVEAAAAHEFLEDQRVR